MPILLKETANEVPAGTSLAESSGASPRDTVGDEEVSRTAIEPMIVAPGVKDLSQLDECSIRLGYAKEDVSPAPISSSVCVHGGGNISLYISETSSAEWPRAGGDGKRSNAAHLSLSGH